MAVSALRRQVFRTWQPLDPVLAEMGGPLGSDTFFLRNPSGQQIFLYLTTFVEEMTLQWFGRAADSIKILDWGAGKGHVGYLLSKRGFRPDCADVPDGAVRPLLDKVGLPLIPLEHPYELPFADGAYDAVLSYGVLEHVPDDRASLREIARVLRPGGLFFCFNLPFAGSWIMRLAHVGGNHYHERLYDRENTRAMVEAAGLEVTDMWHRQLFPKNRIGYPAPQLWERLDQWLVENTPAWRFATSLEFVAVRR
jgi:SAM-dependent methyltransferase